MTRLRATLVVAALACLLMTLGGHRSLAATRIYVDGTVSGGDGTTWTKAYDDLQAALGAAVSGDEIWVAAGSYIPGNTSTDTFALKNGVSVYGGFASGEASLAERNVEQNPTVLEGDIGLPGSTADNVYHVVTGSGTNSSAVLDGFVIRGGNASAGVTNGGGLLIDAGSPTLRNLVVTHNQANFLGGGALAYNGNPTFSNVTFAFNNAGSGGGFAALNSDAAISDSEFVGNAAGNEAGGLYSSLGDPTLTDVSFTENTATDGGAVFFSVGTVKSTRVVFTRNRADASGGGINAAGGTATLTDVILRGNYAGMAGGGIYNSVGTLNIDRALIAGNTVPLTGAGINLNSGTATIKNTTVIRNANPGGAGGIANSGAAVSLLGVTIADNIGVGIENSATTINVDESIIWGNSEGALDELIAATPAVHFNHNLIQGGCPSNSTCSSASTLTANPLLGPLYAGDGFAPGLPPTLGSPAIDTATSVKCAEMGADQLGATRPIDGDKNGTAQCDLGALEYAPPTPLISIAATGTGPESNTTVNIPVSLSGGYPEPLSVAYSVTGITATAGVDFTLAAGTLTFAPLQTSKAIVLKVIDDRIDEPRERLTITLSNPTKGTLGNATIAYTIVDNDPRLTCRSQVATIIGTDGKDTISGTKGADVIVALGGNDIINGNGGDDIICGGPGNDSISGGNGNDQLLGQGGNDTLKGDGGTDLVAGGGGDDRLAGNAGQIDGCDGGPGKDSLLPASGCEAQAGIP